MQRKLNLNIYKRAVFYKCDFMGDRYKAFGVLSRKLTFPQS